MDSVTEHMQIAAGFRTAFGLEPIDFDDRARAASQVNHLASVVQECEHSLVDQAWNLIGALENGASDTTIEAYRGQLVHRLADLTLRTFELADLLGEPQYGQVLADVITARMSAVGQSLRQALSDYAESLRLRSLTIPSVHSQTGM